MTKHERELRAGKFKAFATDEFRIFDMETSIKPKINEGKTIRTRPLTAMEQGFRKLRQMTLDKKDKQTANLKSPSSVVSRKTSLILNSNLIEMSNNLQEDIKD